MKAFFIGLAQTILIAVIIAGILHLIDLLFQPKNEDE